MTTIQPLATGEEAAATLTAVALYTAVSSAEEKDKAGAVEALVSPNVPDTQETSTAPDEEEAAAALAAITLYLQEEQHLLEQEETAPAAAPAAQATPTTAAAPERTVAPVDREPPPIVLTTEGAIYTPDEEEAAAVLAAISLYLQEEQYLLEQALSSQESWHWKASRVLLNQNMAPFRPARRPGWHNIERLRYADRGIPGIVGM